MTAEQRQIEINELAALYADKPGATPFYLMAKGPAASHPEFGTHFNPKLAQHSSYFGALDSLLKCVEKHAGTPVDRQDSVCAKEFKNLRLQAFKDELLYHNVNKRFFMKELAFKAGESPY